MSHKSHKTLVNFMFSVTVITDIILPPYSVFPIYCFKFFILFPLFCFCEMIHCLSIPFFLYWPEILIFHSIPLTVTFMFSNLHTFCIFLTKYKVDRFPYTLQKGKTHEPIIFLSTPSLKFHVIIV